MFAVMTLHVIDFKSLLNFIICFSLPPMNHPNWPIHKLLCVRSSFDFLLSPNVAIINLFVVVIKRKIEILLRKAMHLVDEPHWLIKYYIILTL